MTLTNSIFCYCNKKMLINIHSKSHLQVKTKGMNKDCKISNVFTSEVGGLLEHLSK